MSKDNGGPAFPVTEDLIDRLGCHPSMSDAGISVRDYFASAALPGLLQVCAQDYVPTGLTYSQYIAGRAYELADAMIAERDNGSS